MTEGQFADPHATIADESVVVDLSVPRSIHIVGIGGAGMSAIAEVLVAMGHRVRGSDLKAVPSIERLRLNNVAVTVGHDAGNLAEATDIVAVSTAIPVSNPEVLAARGRGLPIASRAAVLAAIASQRRTVAVAGTHGKTTTASMLALVLVEAGMRPSFLIGGDLNEIGTSAVWDEGPLFVVEADESDGTFLTLPRGAALVTNLEPDHLEHWVGGFAGLRMAFEQFAHETEGPVVVCADDVEAAALGAAVGAVSVGTASDADYRMADLSSDRSGTRFDLVRAGEVIGELVLPIAGEHNARNAAMAAAMAIELGAPFEASRAALARFAGVARRFEYRGEMAGVTFIDDYAHLPTEVRAMLSAARDGEWARVVAVFQPHRYSRTATIGADFADAFDGADVAVITDVYASGEAPRPGVSGKLVAHAVLDAHPWRRLAYLPHREDIISYLVGELRPGDLCLTLGAGDITTLPDEVLARLATIGAAGGHG